MKNDARLNGRMLAVGVPEYREHVDCAGAVHRFLHIPREITEGNWTLEAVEVNPPLAPGYNLKSRVSSSIYTAYLDLLTKIEDAMACKHLTWPKEGAPDLIAGELRGVVANGGVVVDGRQLSFDALVQLLSTHEGFPIKIALGRWAD